MCETILNVLYCCPDCTRPRYEALIKEMDDAATRGGTAEMARKQVRTKFKIDGDNAFNVIANFASTTIGPRKIQADIDRYKTEGDHKTADILRMRLKNGSERAGAVKEAKTTVKKAVEKAKRAETGSRVELVRNPKVMSGTDKSLEEVFPGIAERWDLTHPGNKGILPSEVAPNTNGSIYLKCDLGHSWDGRGNNINVPIKSGKRYYPICPECEGRKPQAYKASQSLLGSLVASLGGDDTAFAVLSPALRMAVLDHMQMLSGSRTSMNRSIAMSIVHGTLTLTDVMNAQDYASIERRVMEEVDEEDALAVLTEAEVKDTKKVASGKSEDATLDQIFATAGILATVNPSSDLAESVLRESSEWLWTHVLRSKTPIDLDGYAAHLRATEYGKDANRDQVLDMFLSEFEAVLAMPLPKGYQSARVDEHGAPEAKNPKLCQRRFAHLVNERRRFMNLSGTGAGKTLAVALAVQTSGAHETLVVCPNDLRDHWKDEFSQGYPGLVEFRDNLPAVGVEFPEHTGTGNRVWVINYDQFSNLKPSDPRLADLAERVDAIVFDEVHRAKFVTEGSASKRRKVLEKLTDLAGEANPDLIVVGASATPVVNNLDEARSILRLVEGPTSARFITTPTIANAAKVYQRFSAVSIRHMPNYTTKLKRDYTSGKVDVTDRLRDVFDHLRKCRKASANNQMTPLAIEQALLPSKTEKVIELVKASESPTVIYTHYTDGIVEPLRDALVAAGLRVGVHAGQPVRERHKVLAQFRDGDFDVIIGSSTLGTGVDGLQKVSQNMVVLSMPWTAAADDQLVGRLQRYGQDKNVTITYVLSEAKIGKIGWSYCGDHRLRRVTHKRDLANAAVDGILPDGVFDSQDNSAERAFAQIEKMVALLEAA